MSDREVHYVPSWSRKFPCPPPKRSKLVLCRRKTMSISEENEEKTEETRPSLSGSDVSKPRFDLRSTPLYSWDDMALRVLAPFPTDSKR